MSRDFDSAQQGMAAYIKQMDQTDRNTDPEAQKYSAWDDDAESGTGRGGSVCDPEDAQYREAKSSVQDWQSQLSGIQAGDLDPSDFDREGEEMLRLLRASMKNKAEKMDEAAREEFLDGLTESEKDMLEAAPHAVIFRMGDPGTLPSSPVGAILSAISAGETGERPQPLASADVGLLFAACGPVCQRLRPVPARV